jgi:predicted DNA-binding transcriptional regulator AlpA
MILTTKEATGRCGLSESFMHKSRVRGDGPPYLKVGRRAVRYDASKLDAWLAAHERTSTSQRPWAAKANATVPPPREHKARTGKARP